MVKHSSLFRRIGQYMFSLFISFKLSQNWIYKFKLSSIELNRFLRSSQFSLNLTLIVNYIINFNFHVLHKPGDISKLHILSYIFSQVKQVLHTINQVYGTKSFIDPINSSSSIEIWCFNIHPTYMNKVWEIVRYCSQIIYNST